MTEKAREAVKLSWGTLLQASLILVTVVSLFKTLEARVDSTDVKVVANKVAILDHSKDDEKRWDENSEDLKAIKAIIDGVKIIQTEIRISQSKTTADYGHILREIEKLSMKFDQYEVNE